MTDRTDEGTPLDSRDAAPGEESHGRREPASGLSGYLLGLALAALLTATAFYLPRSGLLWGPSIPMALIALAVAQMGVHLVFFLHITTGPDNVNNVLALAFGVLIVMLVIFGSVWIMTHLNHSMAPAKDMVTHMM
jgi:cytochrome o ubiquinol oxidase operon protein cyoD